MLIMLDSENWYRNVMGEKDGMVVSKDIGMLVNMYWVQKAMIILLSCQI